MEHGTPKLSAPAIRISLPAWGVPWGCGSGLSTTKSLDLEKLQPHQRDPEPEVRPFSHPHLLLPGGPARLLARSDEVGHASSEGKLPSGTSPSFPH